MYHIVLIPRYRYKILVDGVDEYLKIKMDEVRKTYAEVECLERNIQSDHVHIVINFPPKYSIAKLVQIIKQNTGRALYEKFEFIRKRYWGRGGIRSVGYFVSTLGLDEKTILEHVNYQEREDLGQAKLAFEESPDASLGMVQACPAWAST